MMLHRNLKIIEAVGFLLILGAWFFEWGSYQKWERIQQDFEAQMTREWESVFTSTRDMFDNLRYEANLVVSKMGGELDLNDTNDLYYKAWESARVRLLWHQYLIHEYSNLKSLNEFQLKEAAKYKLEIAEEEANKYADICLKEITKAVFLLYQDSEGKVHVGFPPAAIFTQSKALELHNMLTKYISTIKDVSYAINEAMKKKQIFWSSIFRCLFLIGSILAVLAKIVEWDKERKSDC